MAESHEHIFLNNVVRSEKFTSASSARGPVTGPVRDRNIHAEYLLSRFESLWNEQSIQKIEREAISLPSREGTYLEFKSSANEDLITKSLEDVRKGIRLLNVRTVKDENQEDVITATVYIPQGKETAFIKKIQDYADEKKDSEKGNPKNAPLVNSIEDIRLAILESFWPDSEKAYIPQENPTWCEAWLRINDEENLEDQVTQFTDILDRNQIRYKGHALHFPERSVLLIFANSELLSSLIMETELLAEFRIGQEAASLWADENNTGQSEWADELLSRIHIEETNIKVCILDSGVNNGHILLAPILADDNCLTVDPTWGTDDRSEIGGSKGHGTIMAGLVGYGNLQKALESTGTTIITHKLCSVKILPNRGETIKELWGDITEQAIYRAEAVNVERVLLYCLAVTSDIDVDRGRPSSWSGSIDRMSFGLGNKKRLIIISGGNIHSEECWRNYPDYNKLYSVQNPAQSWNALTVGAFTDKVMIADHRYDVFERVAPQGGVSPYNSTSSLWSKKWPIKPEIVFEGGNLLKREGSFERHTDLELLTTSKNISYSQFDTINATSASTAQISWLAAKIAYQYPAIWPETIRALIVHSAQWTDEMIRQYNIHTDSKTQVGNLLRICGYGVPNIDRALFSYENGLTFVAQESIQPFIKEGNLYKTNQMHIYDLPWPKDLLISLGETPVKLRVTLSYFIEPGAGEIGWRDKYRYQSYGLRFDINNIGESEDQFKKRINLAAREDDEGKPETTAGSDRWTFGKQNRDVGSIHSDVWEGTAANIADCNKIAVFPIIGWWRERHNLKKFNAKGRYSLIVSLDTPAENVEIYSTVQVMIQIPIEIPAT